MIVCSCHGVTDHELRKACQSGAAESCRAGTGCGGCLLTVAAIVEQTRRDAVSPGGADLRPPAGELRAKPQG